MSKNLGSSIPSIGSEPDTSSMAQEVGSPALQSLRQHVSDSAMRHVIGQNGLPFQVPLHQSSNFPVYTTESTDDRKPEGQVSLGQVSNHPNYPPFPYNFNTLSPFGDNLSRLDLMRNDLLPYHIAYPTSIPNPPSAFSQFGYQSGVQNLGNFSQTYFQPFPESNLRSTAPSLAGSGGFNTLNQASPLAQQPAQAPLFHRSQRFLNSSQPAFSASHSPEHDLTGTGAFSQGEQSQRSNITANNEMSTTASRNAGTDQTPDRSSREASSLPSSAPNSANVGSVTRKRQRTRAKTERKRRRTVSSGPDFAVNEGPACIEDERMIDTMIEAMCDMSATEDNGGMLDTWRKMKATRAEKMRRVCQEILAKMKECHAQNGKALGDRKPVHEYSTFNVRFEAVLQALRTQKTVCKHLLEDPYLLSVAEDPLQAVIRVQSNRRVNGAKKANYDTAKKLAARKTYGKNHSKTKVKDKASDLEETLSESGESSLEIPDGTPEERSTGARRSLRPRQFKKPLRHSDLSEDEEVEHSMEHPPHPKKQPKPKVSSGQHVFGHDGGEGGIVGSSREQRFDTGYTSNAVSFQPDVAVNDPMSQPLQDFAQPLGNYFGSYSSPDDFDQTTGYERIPDPIRNNPAFEVPQGNQWHEYRGRTEQDSPQ